MAERPTPDAVFKRWRGEVGGVKPTVFYGAPTGFAGMLASPHLPKREDVALRLVSSAGEALPADIGERFKRHFGVDIVDGIGSTEMLHIFISNRPDKVRYGTTGWPVPGYDIELRGDGGAGVPDGEPGDLYIHGPSAALMYWGNREKTRETFQGGWTKAGDKYIRNADGSYTYAGRTDDMLKVGGVYVSPFEVEATIVQHPAVLEAAVIGVPDAEGLTKTKAFVVLRPGEHVDEAEIKHFVKERLAPYKYPARDRVHRGTAEDGHRQDPALSPEGERGARLSEPPASAEPVLSVFKGLQRIFRATCAGRERLARTGPKFSVWRRTSNFMGLGVQICHKVTPKPMRFCESDLSQYLGKRARVGGLFETGRFGCESTYG